MRKDCTFPMVPYMYHKTPWNLAFWPKNCKNRPKTSFFALKIAIKKVWTMFFFWKLACTFLLGPSKNLLDKNPMNFPPLPKNRKTKFGPKKSDASSPWRRGKLAKIYQYFFVENQICVADFKIKSWKNPVFFEIFAKNWKFSYMLIQPPCSGINIDLRPFKRGTKSYFRM